MTSKHNLDDLDSLRKIIEALEGFQADEQGRILRWAKEKLGLPGDSPRDAARPAEIRSASEGMEAPPPPKAMDIKTFIASKNPASDNQFAAAVAYFHRFEAPEHLRKDTITKDDLVEACRKVGRNRLGAPAQTLVNAHSQGLLDRADKGAYSINTVGENLVAVALPSDGSARVTQRRKRKPQAAARAKGTKAIRRSKTQQTVAKKR